MLVTVGAPMVKLTTKYCAETALPFGVVTAMVVEPAAPAGTTNCSEVGPLTVAATPDTPPTEIIVWPETKLFPVTVIHDPTGLEVGERFDTEGEPLGTPTSNICAEVAMPLGVVTVSAVDPAAPLGILNPRDEGPSTEVGIPMTPPTARVVCPNTKLLPLKHTHCPTGPNCGEMLATVGWPVGTPTVNSCVDTTAPFEVVTVMGVVPLATAGIVNTK